MDSLLKSIVLQFLFHPISRKVQVASQIKSSFDFLEIAISSSYELETQLILVEELFNLATNETIEKLHALQNRIGGFMRQIRERIETEN